MWCGHGTDGASDAAQWSWRRPLETPPAHTRAVARAANKRRLRARQGARVCAMPGSAPSCALLYDTPDLAAIWPPTFSPCERMAGDVGTLWCLKWCLNMTCAPALHSALAPSLPPSSSRALARRSLAPATPASPPPSLVPSCPHCPRPSLCRSSPRPLGHCLALSFLRTVPHVLSLALSRPSAHTLEEGEGCPHPFSLNGKLFRRSRACPPPTAHQPLDDRLALPPNHLTNRQ